MTRAGLALASLLAASAAAAQQAVEVTRPYGSPAGCASSAGQAAASDDLLLITPEAITMSSSVCTIVQKITAPDGTLIVTGLCDLEGEEGRSIGQFSISRGKQDPAALAVFDEYGDLVGEVPACQ